MNNILSFNNISKSYGKLLALDKISFDIPKNSIYGILGSNGSGKSTLMRILANLILNYSGTISFNNKKINKTSQNAINSFGFLIENPAFYEYLSGKQNLEILFRISNTNISNINEVLDLVELSDRSNDKVKTYSYGMKQRLGLAQALLHDPEVLVLDEPNNGLDPKGIKDMSAIIKKLQSNGKTIILSTHILSEVESLCSHFMIVKNGKKIFTSSMEELLFSSNQYTIEVNEVKIAKEILLNTYQVQKLSEDGQKINLITKNKLDLNKLQKIFENKVTIYEFYKNSGLIEKFND